ncbi:MAG: VWA domain-containing protein, partial [Proteobacteria bacterium]|nr:VWA domain-containing protein [Pseudomonadota bacterium]NIS72533.1 VWA domain-containing protein [Pseudomonadota bacterium]
MSLEFLNPQALWVMLALPLVLGVIVWGLRRRKAILSEFGALDLLAQFSRLPFSRKVLYQKVSIVLCFALLIVATARPLLCGNSDQIKKGTLDAVAVLDVSKSMAAEDAGPGVSRLDRSKDVLLGCFPDLAGNRLGMVTFAGSSFPQAELTDDFQALTFVLRHWVGVDSAPFQGSNLGEGLSEAVRCFEKSDKQKIILLFSDGGHVRQENLEGILTDIAARGIKVISVGVGSHRVSRIPVYEEGEFKEWFKIEGKEAVTQLNEGILREISQATGGKYIHLSSGNELHGVFRDSAVMGKSVLSGGKEIFQIPLALSILLLFAGIYFER